MSYPFALPREKGVSSPFALHLTCVNPTQNLYVRKGCVDLGQPEFADILSKLQDRLFNDGAYRSKRVRIIPSFGRIYAISLSWLISLAMFLLITQPELGATLLMFPAAFWLNSMKRQTILISKYPLTRSYGEDICPATLPPTRLELQQRPSPPFGDSFAFVRYIRRTWWGRELHPRQLVFFMALISYIYAITLAEQWSKQRIRRLENWKIG